MTIASSPTKTSVKRSDRDTVPRMPTGSHEPKISAPGASAGTAR